MLSIKNCLNVTEMSKSKKSRKRSVSRFRHEGITFYKLGRKVEAPGNTAQKTNQVFAILKHDDSLPTEKVKNSNKTNKDITKDILNILKHKESSEFSLPQKENADFEYLLTAKCLHKSEEIHKNKIFDSKLSRKESKIEQFHYAEGVKKTTSNVIKNTNNFHDIRQLSIGISFSYETNLKNINQNWGTLSEFTAPIDLEYRNNQNENNNLKVGQQSLEEPVIQKKSIRPSKNIMAIAKNSEQYSLMWLTPTRFKIFRNEKIDKECDECKNQKDREFRPPKKLRRKCPQSTPRQKLIGIASKKKARKNERITMTNRNERSLRKSVRLQQIEATKNNNQISTTNLDTEPENQGSLEIQDNDKIPTETSTIISVSDSDSTSSIKDDLTNDINEILYKIFTFPATGVQNKKALHTLFTNYQDNEMVILFFLIEAYHREKKECEELFKSFHKIAEVLNSLTDIYNKRFNGNFKYVSPDSKITTEYSNSSNFLNHMSLATGLKIGFSFKTNGNSFTWNEIVIQKDEEFEVTAIKVNRNEETLSKKWNSEGSKLILQYYNSKEIIMLRENVNIEFENSINSDLRYCPTCRKTSVQEDSGSLRRKSKVRLNCSVNIRSNKNCKDGKQAHRKFKHHHPPENQKSKKLKKYKIIEGSESEGKHCESEVLKKNQFDNRSSAPPENDSMNFNHLDNYNFAKSYANLGSDKNLDTDENLSPNENNWCSHANWSSNLVMQNKFIIPVENRESENAKGLNDANNSPRDFTTELTKINQPQENKTIPNWNYKRQKCPSDKKLKDSQLKTVNNPLQGNEINQNYNVDRQKLPYEKIFKVAQFKTVADPPQENDNGERQKLTHEKRIKIAQSKTMEDPPQEKETKQNDNDERQKLPHEETIKIEKFKTIADPLQENENNENDNSERQKLPYENRIKMAQFKTMEHPPQEKVTKQNDQGERHTLPNEKRIKTAQLKTTEDLPQVNEINQNDNDESQKPHEKIIKIAQFKTTEDPPQVKETNQNGKDEKQNLPHDTVIKMTRPKTVENSTQENETNKNGTGRKQKFLQENKIAEAQSRTLDNIPQKMETNAIVSSNDFSLSISTKNNEQERVAKTKDMEIFNSPNIIQNFRYPMLGKQNRIIQHTTDQVNQITSKYESNIIRSNDIFYDNNNLRFQRFVKSTNAQDSSQNFVNQHAINNQGGEKYMSNVVYQTFPMAYSVEHQTMLPKPNISTHHFNQELLNYPPQSSRNWPSNQSTETSSQRKLGRPVKHSLFAKSRRAGEYSAHLLQEYFPSLPSQVSYPVASVGSKVTLLEEGSRTGGQNSHFPQEAATSLKVNNGVFGDKSASKVSLQRTRNTISHQNFGSRNSIPSRNIVNQDRHIGIDKSHFNMQNLQGDKQIQGNIQNSQWKSNAHIDGLAHQNSINGFPNTHFAGNPAGPVNNNWIDRYTSNTNATREGSNKKQQIEENKTISTNISCSTVTGCESKVLEENQCDNRSSAPANNSNDNELDNFNSANNNANLSSNENLCFHGNSSSSLVIQNNSSTDVENCESNNTKTDVNEAINDSRGVFSSEIIKITPLENLIYNNRNKKLQVKSNTGFFIKEGNVDFTVDNNEMVCNQSVCEELIVTELLQEKEVREIVTKKKNSDIQEENDKKQNSPTNKKFKIVQSRIVEDRLQENKARPHESDEKQKLLEEKIIKVAQCKTVEDSPQEKETSGIASTNNNSLSISKDYQGNQHQHLSLVEYNNNGNKDIIHNFKYPMLNKQKSIIQHATDQVNQISSKYQSNVSQSNDIFYDNNPLRSQTLLKSTNNVQDIRQHFANQKDFNIQGGEKCIINDTNQNIPMPPVVPNSFDHRNMLPAQNISTCNTDQVPLNYTEQSNVYWPSSSQLNATATQEKRRRPIEPLKPTKNMRFGEYVEYWPQPHINMYYRPPELQRHFMPESVSCRAIPRADLRDVNPAHRTANNFLAESLQYAPQVSHPDPVTPVGFRTSLSEQEFRTGGQRSYFTQEVCTSLKDKNRTFDTNSACKFSPQRKTNTTAHKNFSLRSIISSWNIENQDRHMGVDTGYLKRQNLQGDKQTQGNIETSHWNSNAHINRIENNSLADQNTINGFPTTHFAGNSTLAVTNGIGSYTSNTTETREGSNIRQQIEEPESTARHKRFSTVTGNLNSNNISFTNNKHCERSSDSTGLNMELQISDPVKITATNKDKNTVPGNENASKQRSYIYPPERKITREEALKRIPTDDFICYKNVLYRVNNWNVLSSNLKLFSKTQTSLEEGDSFYQDLRFSCPCEYLRELQLVIKYVPEDFGSYYAFITRRCIYNKKPVIAFLTFLNRYNRGDLKKEREEYVQYLMSKPDYNLLDIPHLL